MANTFPCNRMWQNQNKLSDYTVTFCQWTIVLAAPKVHPHLVYSPSENEEDRYPNRWETGKPVVARPTDVQSATADFLFVTWKAGSLL